jgi:hypothetical protein
MGGLARICKSIGAIKVTGDDGKTVRYVWDYAADAAVPENEMPMGSERWRASERAKWTAQKKD